MKCSWIVVFGLSALSIALGAHALGIYMDAKISASQVAGANAELTKVRARTSELIVENDVLAAALAGKSLKLDAAERKLAEEERTHAALRKQIESMNGSDTQLTARIDSLNKSMASIRRRLATEIQASSAVKADGSKLKELEAENAALTKKINDADSLLDSVRKENDALVRDLKVTTQKSGALEKSVAAEREKTQKLAKDMALVHERIKQLEKDLDAAKRDKERFAEEISRLESSLQDNGPSAQ